MLNTDDDEDSDCADVSGSDASGSGGSDGRDESLSSLPSSSLREDAVVAVVGDPAPKSVPDFESNGAHWATADEIAATDPRAFRVRDTPELVQSFHQSIMTKTTAAATTTATTPPPPTATTNPLLLLGVDDPAVAALDDAIRAATAVGETGHAAMRRAWAAFEKAVPRHFTR